MRGMPSFVTSLVVGANRGIGLELCRQLHERGDRVIGVCRTASDELKNMEIFKVIEGIDVSSEEKVKTLKTNLGADVTKIDNLWLNAGVGIGIEDSLDELNFDGIRTSFEINTLGPLRCIKTLLPFLKEGSKVLLMTSRMGSIADNTSGASYGYRMSKAALNIAGKSLAIDLEPQGIAIAILHPGFVKTDMTKPYWGEGGIISPSESAHMLVDTATNRLNLRKTGTFFHANGQELPW